MVVGHALPDFENERLIELERTGILDSVHNAEIQELLCLVRDVFGAQSCCFNLVTDERQFEKNVDGVSLGDMNRDQFFCQHVVSQNRLISIPDTGAQMVSKTYPRAAGGPAVLSYIGVPVHGRKGLPIGTLCVVDNKVHDRYSTRHKAVLTRAANILRHRTLWVADSLNLPELPDNVQSAPQFGRTFSKMLHAGREKDGNHAILFFCQNELAKGSQTQHADKVIREMHEQLLTRISTISMQIAGTVAGAIGDRQFGIAINANIDVAAAETMARRMSLILNAAIETSKTAIDPHVRIGVVVDDGQVGSGPEVLDFCNSVLAFRKHFGSDIIVLNRDLFEKSIQLTAGQSLLHTVIQKGRLTLLYQPVVSAANRKVSGFEALVRWRDPILGDFGALDILELCEREGLQETLDYAVFEMACKAAQKREALHGDGAKIAINIDTDTLRSPRFVRKITQIVASTKVDPGLVEIEITEHTLFTKHEKALVQMEALINIGITFVLDDFGTGYSSLSHLQRLPLGKIKIDQSFVSRMEDPKTQTLVTALISIANSLDLETTGEGAESEEQIKQLNKLGCKYIQGFKVAKPLPEKDYLAYV